MLLQDEESKRSPVAWSGMKPTDRNPVTEIRDQDQNFILDSKTSMFFVVFFCFFFFNFVHYTMRYKIDIIHEKEN